jgi:nucleotide-binding universal stress UspA family protein
MYPWRRILIPTDFSTASEWAFDDAVHAAGVHGAELLVLHVRITDRGRPDKLRFPADESVYEYAERVELEKLRDRMRRANSNVRTRLVVKQAPDPGNEICRTAREESADLIVISTHARHHVAHLLIGSTTLSVLKDPPAPVLAIRYGTPRRLGFRRIVVPVHTKQTTDAAALLAGEIAARESGVVDLLIVCEDKDRGLAEARVREVAGRMPGQPKQVLMRGNDVEEAIVRHARETKADAIFINAQKEIGNVKRDVIRKIDVPVMIVPT